MIISPNFLNSIAQSYKITEDSQKSILSENKNYFFESGHTDINRNYDIFLSHSYLDKVHVLALVKLFNIHQFSVYVDWLEDNQLNTNATDMLIVNAYRNLLETSASIAKRFNVSDTYAHEVFNRYVKLDTIMKMPFSISTINLRIIVN